MSQPITLNYDQAQKSLSIIATELDELKSGLHHLHVVFTDAAEKSNIGFIKAISEKYEVTTHIFARLSELITEVRTGLSRYEKEYTAYEQS